MEKNNPDIRSEGKYNSNRGNYIPILKTRVTYSVMPRTGLCDTRRSLIQLNP